MAHLRHPDTALRLLNHTNTQRYICRACLAHATRQFHTTRPSSAEKQSFFERMRESVFGSSKSRETSQRREEKQSKKVKEESAKKEYGVNLRTVKDREGRKFQVADVADPNTTQDYRPAVTWDGLSSVGGKAWVQARADRGEVYHGFYPTKTLQPTEKQWNAILHNVVVEILALQSAGRNVNEVCLPHGTPELERITFDASIIPDRQGKQASLDFTNEEAKQNLLKAIPTEGDEAQPQREIREALRSDHFQQTVQDPSTWMKISLKSPEMKLAVVKRITQLTGRRLADHAISNANTVGQLRDALIVKANPKKLANNPSLKDVQKNLPNVTMHSRRRTPIHKEKQVGRWKVIEEELIARDLPVTGTRWKGAKSVVADT